MATGLPRASTVEGLRFTAQVVIPNVVQGLFRRRRTAVAAATAANADKHALGLITGLRRSHGPGPVWVRVVKDQTLVLLDEADVRTVLEGAPSPFAADPDAKRNGMAHFQPDALTISRGAVWENRRRFTDSVLAGGEHPHPLAGRLEAVAREEGRALVDSVRGGGGELAIEELNDAVRRIARRVILGDIAGDDEALSEDLARMMDAANGMPGKPSDDLAPFMSHLERHIASAQPDSLAARFADAPQDDETEPAGQVVHWLFALGDTLAINALRALALLAVHPHQAERAARESRYMTACLEEAMRLWPTTAMLSRETVEATELGGERIPEGTQVMIVNTFFHRDAETIPYADRFAPEEWLDGDAAGRWTFNAFSHGPQGCPGASIALAIGTTLLTELLAAGEWALENPALDPARPLPHMLDYFAITLSIS